MAEREPESRTLLESALTHERWVLATLLVGVPLACWAWIAVMADDMYGTMRGAAAWMMTSDWDVPHLLLLWAMWAVMMTAMMLPSAAPLLLMYAGALRGRGEPRAGRQLFAMAAGYVLVWAGFSIAATVLQRALASALVLTPMMEPDTPVAAAAILAIAGALPVDAAQARLPARLPLAACASCCSTGGRGRPARCGSASTTDSTASAAAGR